MSPYVIRRLTQCAAAALVLLSLPNAARAQMGSSTDILTGVVKGPDAQPLDGATVEATSLDLQLTRRAHTNADGRYTIVFPDGGGRYRLTVKFIGMAPLVADVMRQADDDRLVRDVVMTPTATRLATVTVTGRARQPRERQTPGATGRMLGGEQAARLPIDAGDLAALAALAPGVVPIAGTDTTGEGFSIAALSPTTNSVTLDGSTYNAGTVPQDAVRATRVITNSYDVARGQFLGGIVATTTRGGTNVPSGSLTYALRDRHLAVGIDAGSPFSQGYTQQQLGGGFGGAIVKDRVFLFGALQARRRTDLTPSLLNADPASLLRLGANPDSVSQFLNGVQADGIAANPSAFGDTRTRDDVGGLARTDFYLSDAQTLMLRGDWRWSRQDPTRLGALALPSTGGTSTDRGGGLMALLTSNFGTFLNELRAYGSLDTRGASPYVALPQGRVQLASPVGDSTRAVSTLVFGGNPGMPQRAHTAMLETSDELSWLPGDASHRVKLGVLLDVQRFEQTVTPDRWGTFTYASLSDFEGNQPSMYTRTLSPQVRAGTAVSPTVYLGDTWRGGGGLQLTYGLRLEGSSYRGAPAYNPQVDSLFGLRTDRFPSEVHLSPRIGATWVAGGGEGFALAPTILRAGLGEFRSPVPTGLFAGAEGATGIAGSAAQLVCVGSDVPVPDWTLYGQDTAAIPTSCAAGGGPSPAQALPTVTVLAPDFGAPRAWRASFGVTHRFFQQYSVSLDASWVRGTNLTGVRDANLDPTPQFTLASEGNRPVFVPADAIVPGTGVAGVFASRLHPDLGQVFELASDRRSEATQVTLGVNGFTLRGLLFQASYTWMHARDQSSFDCCSPLFGLAQATTAGNPNVAQWGPSDRQREHQFLLTATYPISETFEITAIGRLLSGAPFTPMVGSDINGDGLRDDRAFIFDPATTTDTAVANGMRRLLAGTPSSVRDCLTRQLGRIAGRNTCEGPWQPSLDFQLNFRPSLRALGRRLTISVLTVNLLAGVDQLLHGVNDLHGWGSFTRPDPTLLYVRGFDAGTRQYRYVVNERFGAATGAAAAFRTPFQIAIQVHYTVGQDQALDRLRGIFGGGRGGRGAFRGGAGGPGGPGGAGGAAANAAAFAERFASVLPNPVTAILALRDSLQLTDSQVTRLAAVGDSLDRENGVLRDSIRAAIQAAGTQPNPMRLFGAIRPRLIEGRRNVQRALDAARQILTDRQWKMVPEEVKRPTRGGRRRQ